MRKFLRILAAGNEVDFPRSKGISLPTTMMDSIGVRSKTTFFENAYQRVFAFLIPEVWEAHCDHRIEAQFY